MSPGVMRVLLIGPVLLVSLCVHEFAHAAVAYLRGDQTARLAGRLTLNPLAHLDWMGTVVLPGLCLASGFPVFGWAKPVPVDERNLRHGRRDFALVAAAGPVSNIFLALLSTAILSIFPENPGESWGMAGSIIPFLAATSIRINLMLAVFNILPVPPLDGFNLVMGIMPKRWLGSMAVLYRYSGILLIVLLFSGLLRYLSIPIQIAYNYLLSLAGF